MVYLQIPGWSCYARGPSFIGDLQLEGGKPSQVFSWWLAHGSWLLHCAVVLPDGLSPVSYRFPVRRRSSSMLQPLAKSLPQTSVATCCCLNGSSPPPLHGCPSHTVGWSTNGSGEHHSYLQATVRWHWRVVDYLEAASTGSWSMWRRAARRKPVLGPHLVVGEWWVKAWLMFGQQPMADVISDWHSSTTINIVIGSSNILML